MRTLYDSTNPDDIPVTVEAVAGYLDLWPAGAWDRFTNATIKRHIARNAAEDGDTADVETGDLTPQEAPAWARRALARGVVKPWCYCSLSVKTALFQAMAANHLILHQDWEWWSAGYFDGTPRLDPDAIATQYIDPPRSGGHYDLSLISDSWQGGDDVTLTPEEAAQLTKAAGADDKALDLQTKMNNIVIPDLDQLKADVADIRAKVAAGGGSVPPHQHSVTGTAS
jgi:hypothetical protein